MDIITWLKDGWIILTVCIGGITLIWNFLHKTLKEIGESLSKPIRDIDSKIDDVNVKLGDVMKNAEIRKHALLALQRHTILQTCESYIKRNYATIEEKETLEDQFKSYEEMGGNSFVGDIISQVRTLPIEKKSKKVQKGN